jgi:hypothetical protein
MASTMSKTLSTVMVMVVQTTAMVPQICGTMILKKIWRAVGAVEHGRLDGFFGDAAQGGRQDHHGKAGLDPDQDDHQEEVVPEGQVIHACGSPPNHATMALRMPIWSLPSRRGSHRRISRSPLRRRRRSPSA